MLFKLNHFCCLHKISDNLKILFENTPYNSILRHWVSYPYPVKFVKIILGQGSLVTTYWHPAFTFETFGKKLAETKIVARVNVKKIKAKKNEKSLLNRLRWSSNDFLPKFVNNGESRRFFGRCWGFAEMLWVKISS